MLTNITLINKNRDLASVVIEYSYKGKQKRWGTGIKIPSSYWNSTRQLIKASGTDDVESDNHKIYELKSRIDKIIKTHFSEFGHAPSIEHVEREFNKAIEAKQAMELTLLDRMNEYLIAKENNKLTYETIKTYKSLRTNLLEFQQKHKVQLTFEHMDAKFCDRFIAMLLSSGKYSALRNGKMVTIKRNKYLNSTIARRIKALRDFLNYFAKTGENSNLAFKDFKHSAVKNVNTDVITLENSEFESIRILDLSHKPYLDRVRDLFVFSCSTGLRFSDVIRINQASITGTHINIVTQKTKQNLSIPLNPISKSILEKYLFTLPVISNQKFNKYLKEVAMLIPELHKKETIITFSGSSRNDRTTEKYNLISSHTGRRTFVTLCLEKGTNPANIMLWTGHKSLNMFLLYINKRQGELEQMAKAFG